MLVLRLNYDRLREHELLIVRSVRQGGLHINVFTEEADLGQTGEGELLEAECRLLAGLAGPLTQHGACGCKGWDGHSVAEEHYHVLRDVGVDMLI